MGGLRLDFPFLRNLMEIYLSNNQIGNTQEINHLKQLPKLIILDLQGNALQRDANYRVYTLFVLSRLKVLDGLSVEPSEHQIVSSTMTTLRPRSCSRGG